MIISALVILVSAAGCSKDTDCKGARVCEYGRCVNPPVLSPPVVVQPEPVAPPPTQQDPAMVPEDPYEQQQPVPAPAPVPQQQPYPRTVYEKGYVCHEFIDASGSLRRDCQRDRRAQKEMKREAKEERRERIRERREAEREQRREIEGPSARFVGNIVAHGGMLVAATPTTAAIYGAFGASGSAGVMFRSGIGIVGVANVQLAPNGFGIMQMYSLGPAVRFGSKSHVLVGVAPTLGVVPANTQSPAAVGLLASVFAQGSLVLLDRLTLMLQPVLSSDGRGVILTLTGGIGVQF